MAQASDAECSELQTKRYTLTWHETTEVTLTHQLLLDYLMSNPQ
jgi:hypothetical protein